MKKLMCNDCNRTQTTGKYCLDCGTQLSVVETKVYKPIDTLKSNSTVKRDVRKWLERIGVHQFDIKIKSNGETAKIEYVLDQKVYSFESFQQNNITNNLAAIEQFLHYRVLGIERGIETVEKAFAGYEALPDHTNNAYAVLGATKTDSLAVIKTKYKTLAKMFHPDINKGVEAEEQFKKINEAWEKIQAERNS